jgi:hypothetical protein
MLISSAAVPRKVMPVEEASEHQLTKDKRRAAKSTGWWVGPSPHLLVAAMLMGLLTACASAVPPPTDSLRPSTAPEATVNAAWRPDGRSVDPITAQLLQRYGLVARGPTTTLSIPIGALDEVPWDQYLEASRRIGLGHDWHSATDADLRQTPVASVGGINGGRVHVLISDGRLAGAWLSDDVSVPGLYALSEGP